jgi:hypothetical protein
MLYDNLKTLAPIFCKGTRNGHEVKDKRKLVLGEHYIFGKLLKKTGWDRTDGLSRKCDKVLFPLSFVETLEEVLKTKPTKNNIQASLPSLPSLPVHLQDELKLPYAPDIINLQDTEKFQGENGVPLEIETRGERTHDKIYFLVRDVSDRFEMNYLNDVIINGYKDGYQENIHYNYFICKRYVNGRSDTNKQIVKKELFLTYKGILRVLFVSRSKNAERFVDWATKSLFTLQLGNRQQKEKLVANTLGVTAKVIKEVFNTDANQFPCIYLFTLGKARDLRVSMNIPTEVSDESVVCKYGFTKDLARRTGEHLTNYSKITGVELRLKHHVYIDPQYISNAETKISNYMKDLKLNLEYCDEKELVIVQPELTELVTEQYQQIGKAFMGHISEFVTRIKDLEQSMNVQKLRSELELQKVRHENELELQQARHEIELLRKDLEIAQLRLSLK